MNPRHTQRRARGFSLVEALVALLVLSIGMLGIAGLHLDSLRSGRVTILRSQAVTLASDLADRIRANREGGTAYGDDVTGEPDLVEDCTAGGCTPAEMAEHDKALWQAAVAAALPSGAGAVDTDAATNPTTYTITITWLEPGLGEQSYVLSIQT